MAEGILFTDLYQLTMAQLYFRYGLHERRVQFDHFFRSYPDYGTHQAGYCINAGLEWLVDWMAEARFGDAEIGYLRSQKTATGDQLFKDDFLAYLRQYGNFDALTLTAIPEGRAVHPNVPLVTVEGPMLAAQILETQLLNQLNYQTLIATKAARIHQAGRGQLMMEFGARRAHGKSAVAGARAALIGGADFTSNAGVSYVLGYPPKGTHAHSMVQVFMSLGMGELEAFRAYAEVYPDDCLLLVDTVNTLESGIPNAITVFNELKTKGHKPNGVRLDSGDLAYLSIRAAKMLDDAGFPETSIVLSSDIDELVLLQIIAQIQDEARANGIDADHVIGRLVFGVGTRLITSHGAGALNGVYKLVAVHSEEGEWLPALKLSESAAKIPNPGSKEIWRIYDKRGKAIVDLLSLDDEHPDQQETLSLHHPSQHTLQRMLKRERISEIENLHETIMADGNLVYEFPSIDALREQRQQDLERLDSGVRLIVNPHIYHVSLTEKLWQMKQDLIRSGGTNTV